MKIDNKYITAWSNSEYNVIPEQFSFGLFFNSSEKRATEYSKLLREQSIEYGLLVNFKDNIVEENKTYNKKPTLKEVNLTENCRNLDKICKRYDVVTIDDIFNYYDNVQKISLQIPNNLYRLESNFFVDITGTPLVYSSAFLKLFKDRFPTPTIYLLNVHAQYINGGGQQFSDGTVSNIYIPGYYGGIEHNKPSLFVFLIGYEGNRSLRILQENEPDKAIVIVADPGYKDNYAQITFAKNSLFLRELGMDKDKTNDGIIKIPIYDIGKVCDTILKIYEKNKDKYSIRLVPLGPKPHAIGAALAAIIQPDMSIMYQVPKKYVLSDISSTGEYWVYKIPNINI